MGAELVVPTSRDAVLALDSPTLYVLEQAGEIAREILDERVIDWSDQGWTQQKIAEEVGCSQSAISRRQARLGVQPSRPIRRVPEYAPRILTNGSDPEFVDAEVIDGQLELDERTDEERVDQLPDDLASRVRADTLPLEEAEVIATESARRLEAWAEQIRGALIVLWPMVGHPIPADLKALLSTGDQRALEAISKLRRS